MNKMAYTPEELMICTAARLIPDKRTCFIGYGIPQIVIILAQKLYAPNACQVYEYGAIGPEVVPPFRRGMFSDSRNNYRAVAWTYMNTMFAHACLGYIDYGFLGAAQIDPYGNINSTQIGLDHSRPMVRFPGSGGANDVASYCWKTITIMKHEKERFVKKLDFLTSPGYLDGPGAREKAGLPAGAGPYRLVTSLGLFGFDEKTKYMELLAVAPGYNKEDVFKNMNFEPLAAKKIEELKPPTEEELRLLREEIDPDREIIGKI
ncbi:MAG: CoA-transferase subunit beta [Thermodesulfobacteriota bacterium]